MIIANIFGGDGLIILVIAVVVIFGGSQLPKIARNVGSAGKEFRKAQKEADEEAAKEAAASAAPASAPAPTAIPAAPAAIPPAPPAAPTVSATAPSDNVTLSRADLDALLAERDERAKGQTQS
ncbi:MAG: twin-arginine translocase TatA/TatE family subunit [Candidatus Dormibacteria bacterium]